jgi:hypothetical protein
MLLDELVSIGAQVFDGVSEMVNGTGTTLTVTPSGACRGIE